VKERGLRRNEQNSQADTTVSDTDSNGVTHITIYEDSSRTTDDQVKHEWGHEQHARKVGGTKFVKLAKEDQKKYPNKEDHDSRETEKVADKFKDQVNKDIKEAKEKKKEDEKMRKKEQSKHNDDVKQI